MKNKVNSGCLDSIYQNDPVLSELIKDFRKKIPIRVGELRNCYDRSEFTDLNRLSHSLKGALLGYGFPVLAETVAVIEEGSKDLVDVSDLGNKLKNLENLVISSDCGG